jgi:acetoin utilization protein AcuB
LFGLLIQDRAGCINSVLQVLRRHDARLMAIMSSYANAPEGFRRVYIRCFHMDRRRTQQLHAELDEVAKTLFIVDRKAGTREIFSE